MEKKSFWQKLWVDDVTLMEYEPRAKRTNKLTVGDGIRVGVGLLIVYIIWRVIVFIIGIPSDLV